MYETHNLANLVSKVGIYVDAHHVTLASRERNAACLPPRSLLWRGWPSGRFGLVDLSDHSPTIRDLLCAEENTLSRQRMATRWIILTIMNREGFSEVIRKLQLN